MAADPLTPPRATCRWRDGEERPAGWCSGLNANPGRRRPRGVWRCTSSSSGGAADLAPRRPAVRGRPARPFGYGPAQRPRPNRLAHLLRSMGPSGRRDAVGVCAERLAPRSVGRPSWPCFKGGRRLPALRIPSWPAEAPGPAVHAAKRSGPPSLVPPARRRDRRGPVGGAGGWARRWPSTRPSAGPPRPCRPADPCPRLMPVPGERRA